MKEISFLLLTLLQLSHITASSANLNTCFPLYRHEGYAPSSYLVEKSPNSLETYE